MPLTLDLNLIDPACSYEQIDFERCTQKGFVFSLIGENTVLLQ